MLKLAERIGRPYEYLQTFDHLVAEKRRKEGCECGGTLHRADYPRKPRGGPPNLDARYQKRLSFCCSVDGCRRRATPPSVRFLGRRVYLGVYVVLKSAMESGLALRHAEYLRQVLKCDDTAARQTIERWLYWWQEQVPKSRDWERVRARLAEPICVTSMPTSLLVQCGLDSNAVEAVMRLLRLVAPLEIDSVVKVNEGRSQSAEDAD